MQKPVVVFDMDGVLVDVTESYREAIRATVAHFSGQEVTRARIQDYKNAGGWNDDWSLSHHLIQSAGVDVDLPTVVEYFQSIFHGGNGTEGLIMREKWLARGGLFDRLKSRFDLAVFTGRLRWEAELTLNRFWSAANFEYIVGAGDVERLKPAPDGLLRIRELSGGSPMWYVGDTVDDARSSAAAGVPFVGIAAPANPRYGELITLLRAEGAVAVLDDINRLEDVLQ